MSESCEYAKGILVHYFRLAIEKAGGTWDSDNAAEIYSAVDDIFAEAVREARHAAELDRVRG